MVSYLISTMKAIACSVLSYQQHEGFNFAILSHMSHQEYLFLRLILPRYQSFCSVVSSTVYLFIEKMSITSIYLVLINDATFVQGGSWFASWSPNFQWSLPVHYFYITHDFNSKSTSQSTVQRQGWVGCTKCLMFFSTTTQGALFSV